MASPTRSLRLRPSSAPSTLSVALASLVACAACANGGPGGSLRFGDDDGGATSDGGVTPADAGDSDGGDTCGYLGDACCPTAGYACVEGRCVDGTCVSCGAVGETCCPGTPCPGGGVCTGETCEACGTAGALCCPGAICEGGTACVDGRCAEPPSPTDCTPGQTQERPCGRCGTETRRCGVDGTWEAFAGCAGEGECTPGDYDGLSLCNAECRWGEFNSCSLSSCPSGSHVVGFTCDGACPSDCAAGFNALVCARNVGRFTACSSCPSDHRAVAGACDPDCYFPCTGGVNAVVCEPI